MFSAWMVGLEDEPDRCGEICIVEVFGDTVTTDGNGRSAARIGCGVHAFRDPRLTEAFAAGSFPIDISINHRYAVDWQPGCVEFLVDDVPVRRVDQAPDYPMQLILGIFDFSGRGPAAQAQDPGP